MADPDEEARWLRKDCHVLTLALHRRTGWPIMTLHDGRISNSRMAMDEAGMLVHSGLVRPDGVFLDARGVIAMSDLGPVEDAYVYYHETWARWLRSDLDAFDVDEFRESMILDGEKLERALADARDFIERELLIHIAGFPVEPMPEAGQLRDAEELPAEVQRANPLADPETDDEPPF